MIEAAIFDMGGVLIESPRTAVGDDLRSELCIDQTVVDAIWQDLIPLLGSGKIDEEEFWKRLSAEHKIRQVSVDENLLGRAFIETLKSNDKLLEYIKKLGQKGIKLAVLSNTIEPHAKPVRQSGIFEPFDHVFLSHEVGHRKPGPEIYQHAIDTMGVDPANSVYVDDDPENVESAQKLGMHGIVAESPQQVIDDLKALIETVDPAEELTRAITVINEDYLAPLENPQFIGIVLLAESLRAKAIEIYQQELAALESLDPNTVTLEDIQKIRADFEGQVEQLVQSNR